MRDGEPIKDFLFLLRSDAVVLVEEVEELGFGFFEGSVGAGLEISKIREYSFFKFFGVDDGTTEGEEPIGQRSNDVCACDVEEVVPES